MTVTAADIVSRAIKEVNAQLTKGEPIEDARGTILMGDEGVIDSVNFAYLIVTIEQIVFDDLDVDLLLFDDEVMEMEENPFSTIGSLTDHLSGKLADG
jgi:hypothetical protein